MLPYIDRHIAQGGRLHQVTRHMLGLFMGRPGARGWRRLLSEEAHLGAWLSGFGSQRHHINAPLCSRRSGEL